MNHDIVLGLGNNIDYELEWDTRIFEDLIVKHSIRDSELSSWNDIVTERDLLVSILSFVKSGNGGERLLISSDIIDTFAEYFKYKITLGGTSIRAAVEMHKLGCASTVHLVTINDHVRRLLPKDCTYVCSAKADTLYPHLIIQFGKGTRIKASDIDILAERDNRVIYTHDIDNLKMSLNENLVDFLTNAKVFLISGFNAMQDQDMLTTRIQTLLNMMKALPENARVFYEDACFHNPILSQKLWDLLLDSIDIYSMNEDELQGYFGGTIDFLSPNEIKDALYAVHRLIPVPVIVIHTRYWALAYGKNATFYDKALKSGITMASTRFRYGDNFSTKEYYEIENYPLQKEGIDFSKKINALSGEDICCLACVQIDEENAATIGLGDAFVGGFLRALAF